MPFLTESGKPVNLKAETIAVCIILACSLQIMENLLPKIPIFPWLRLGLSYWILLPFLIQFGVGQTLLLFLFRNLMTLLYGGQIFSSFLISSSAGMICFVTAGFFARWLYQKQVIGLVGFSIIMASTFNVAQLGVVNQLLIQHSEFYYQLPPILLWSLISGSLIAILVFKSRRTIEGLFVMEVELSTWQGPEGADRHSPGTVVALGAGILSFILILYVRWVAVQVGFLLVLLLLNRLRNLKVLLYAWPFYFYIAFLHLFRTEGVYILGEWVTREGLDEFLFYAIRTTNIILCGQLIAPLIPVLVGKQAGNRFVRGLTFALPVLPAIFGISIALGKDLMLKIKRREFDDLLDPIIERLLAEFYKLKEPVSIR